MGSSVSIPPVTATKLTMGIPTVVDTKIPRTFMGVSVVLTDPQHSHNWLVRLPSGFRGPIVFYDGPNDFDSVMMVSHHLDRQRLQFGITLPESPSEGRQVSTEILNVDEKMVKSDLYWFELKLTYGGTTERFEWRRSNGKEVGDVGFGGKGWKLVKLPPFDQRTQENVPREDRELGLAGDGGEVVAVWKYRHSMSRTGHFELCGSGTTLGQSFALMALATAITLECNVIRKEKKRQRRNAAAAHGGG